MCDLLHTLLCIIDVSTLTRIELWPNSKQMTIANKNILLWNKLTLSLIDGVDARLVIDSRESALRILRPREDGGLSSARPVSGNDAPRLLNTFGGGLKINLPRNYIID